MISFQAILQWQENLRLRVSCEDTPVSRSFNISHGVKINRAEERHKPFVFFISRTNDNFCKQWLECRVMLRYATDILIKKSNISLLVKEDRLVA